MPFLTPEMKSDISRLLGYGQSDEISRYNAYVLEENYTQSNYTRILQIIDRIAAEPPPPTEDEEFYCSDSGGGVDYQLERLYSNVMEVTDVKYNHTDAIKRLRFIGKKLTHELSVIVRVPILNDRYGHQSNPITTVSFPSI